MRDLTFDELANRAARHTSALSGTELIRSIRALLIRYDEIRERKIIAKFIHGLLIDQCFFEENPDTEWSEDAIFSYLNTYEI
ncbi:MAG: hypothetical protein WC900_08430 [Oscillospiraceae bacterium]|jgi:hypothetical protein